MDKEERGIHVSAMDKARDRAGEQKGQLLDVESVSQGLRTLDTKSAKYKKAPNSVPVSLSSLLVSFVLGVKALDPV